METQTQLVPVPISLSAPVAAAGGNNRGINIAGDVVTMKTSDYPDDHRDLVRWLYAFARQESWQWEDVEHQTGISTTTLYRIWTGKYRNAETGELVKLDSVCDKIARFKELAEERAAARRMPFIETSVWKRIEKLAHEALVMQTFAFIYGDGQIGKSEALKEVQRRNNHGQTLYVLTPASGGVQCMMKAIAVAANISPRTCFEGLRDRIAKALDPTKLLILDEVHELFASYAKASLVKCLSVLRQLQEQSACGMVLCGTDVFRNELERGEFAQSLQQLRRRGIWELQLEPSPKPEDLELIARHYGLGQPRGEARELVKWVSVQHGLGKYIKFMRRAAQAAAAKKEKFGWEHFIKIVGIAAKLREPVIVEWN